MARDISLLAQSEIAEVREPGPAGRGRSSTMPQKRNPVGCAAILAAAVRAPAWRRRCSRRCRRARARVRRMAGRVDDAPRARLDRPRSAGSRGVRGGRSRSGSAIVWRRTLSRRTAWSSPSRCRLH
jgi:hypothetical protein